MPERNASREIKIRNSIHSLSHIFFKFKFPIGKKDGKNRTHYPLALCRYD